MGQSICFRLRITVLVLPNNKTLLEKHGWTLPKSFQELEQLAKETEEAGVQLCLPQIQYPGYGFQYLCNIADTGFLSSLDGRQWQKDYLSGKANISDTEVISQENCAKLVGRCYAEATGSDLALVSLGTWISGNGLNQNNDCVSSKMYAKDITVDEDFQ